MAKRSGWISCWLLVVLSTPWSALAQDEAEKPYTFDFAFRADPVVENPTGETVQFEAISQIVTRRAAALDRDEETLGAQAWSMGIDSVGCRILSGSTEEMDSDCAPENQGASCFVYLEVVNNGNGLVFGAVPGLVEPVYLSPAGSPHDVLRLSLEGDPTIESTCTSCILRYVDGLRGTDGDGNDGRPIKNIVTANGVDGSPSSLEPVLGETAIAWRPVPCGVGDLDLAEDPAPPAVPLTLTQCGTAACLTLTAPAGQPVLLTLTDADGRASEHSNALYVSWGEPPTPALFDVAAAVPGRASQRLLVPEARNEACYIRVESRDLDPEDTAEVSLSAVLADVALSRVSPTIGARDTRTSLVILGGGFTKGATEFRLRAAADNTVIAPVAATFLARERVEAVFDLSGEIGSYHLDAYVLDGDQQPLVLATLEDSFEIETPLPEVIDTLVTGHSRNGRHRLSRFTLRYENSGNQERTAPFFLVKAPDSVALQLEGDEDSQGSSLLVLGVDPVGFAGRLPGGVGRDLPIIFRGREVEEVTFEVYLLNPQPGDTIDCGLVPAPPGVDDWSTLCGALTTAYGDNWYIFLQSMADIATRLTRRGVNGASALEALRFAVREVLNRPTSAAVGRVIDAVSGAPVKEATVVAFEGETAVSSNETDPLGRFALDWLENGTSYELRVVDYSGVASVDMPDEGDLFGVEILATPGVNAVVSGDANLDESGLPEAPIAPPENSGLYVQQAELSARVVGAIDPNEKYGPDGEQDEGFIGAHTPHVYKISFENTGDAAARTVEILDYIGPGLNPDRVTLREVAWGLEDVNEVLISLDQVSYDLHSGNNLPESGVTEVRQRRLVRHWLNPDRCYIAEVHASIQHGQIRWVFRTLDPGNCDVEDLQDGDFPEPSFDDFEAGFLPPNPEETDPVEGHLWGRGEGYVSFEIETRDDLEEEEPVQNDAAIVFNGDWYEMLSCDEVRPYSRFLPAEEPTDPDPSPGSILPSPSVTLSWEPILEGSTSAYAFDLRIWEEDSPKLILGECQGYRLRGKRPSCSPRGLVYGATYGWDVIARNKKWEPTLGPEWSFHIAPEAPGNMRVERENDRQFPTIVWEHSEGAEYYSVEVSRDSTQWFLVEERLEPGEEPLQHELNPRLFGEPPDPPIEGEWWCRVFAHRDFGDAGIGSNHTTVSFEILPPPRFRRGDSDANGLINMTDGIFILNHLFLGGPTPPCRDAADADNDGEVTITDGIYMLNFLFLGGPEPPAPGHEDCGPDPTPEEEPGCESYTSC